MNLKISPMIFFLLCVAVFAVSAQTNSKNNPFTAGETLTYEGKLSRAFVPGIAVADLVFKIDNAPNSNNYLLVTETKSKGTLPRLFNFSFRQNFESTVERENFRILKTVKHDEQGNRVRDGEATFDYDQRQVTYIETDPKDRARAPRKIASAIREDTLDLLSGIYGLRRLPLAVGKTFDLSISDSGFFYTVPVRVTARERQSTILGKVWCFRVEPDVFGSRRLVEDKGKMIIWITDDKTRVPVRTEIHTGIGKVDIKLKKIGK